MGVPLNVDIAGSISQLRGSLKDFELKLKLYRILFQGKGLDFEGYRPYTSSDDSELIDWKSTMRANKLLVREYKEEQDTQIIFAIDVGEHMLTGSSNKLKAEYMAEAVASLMHLILDSGDKVGMITFSDKVHNVILPRRGNRHFELLVEMLSDSSTYTGGSDMGRVISFMLDYISKSIKSVIIVSDFLSLRNNAKDKMQLLGSRFETLAMMIRDPVDRALPQIEGEVIFEDPVSGEQLLVNPSIAGQAYKVHAMRQEREAMNVFKDSGIDVLDLQTNFDFAPELAGFIKERVRRKGSL